MALTNLLGWVGGESLTCTLWILDVVCGCTYNDRRGIWVMVVVGGVRKEIESSGAGVSNEGVRGRNSGRGGAMVVNRS